jgi:hypothetical protein
MHAQLFSGDFTKDITHHGLLDALHMETWYDGSPATPKELGFVYYENKLLGLPRLRCVRARVHTSCVGVQTIESDEHVVHGAVTI